MSQNRKLNLKVVRGEEIRLMHLVPNTWAEFQATLQEMYGTSEFQATYVDEEGDNITIANDLDLQELYKFYENKPSMKVFLKSKTLADDFEELRLEDLPVEKKKLQKKTLKWKRNTKGEGLKKPNLKAFVEEEMVLCQEEVRAFDGEAKALVEEE